MGSYEAGLIGLIFFFTVFVAIVVWIMLPKNKDRIEELKNIPLKDDENE